MKRNQSKAFTLVELLVVIGIIAVLISILLPALNKARQSAQTTQCLSNIRQLGLACLTYSSDHFGKLPYNSIGNTDGTNDMCNSVVVGLIEEKYIQVGAKRTVDGTRGATTAGVYTPGFLICPANTLPYTLENSQPGKLNALAYLSGRFRNDPTLYQIMVTGAGDEASAAPQFANQGYNGTTNTIMAYTNYCFNAMSSRADWSYWNGPGNHRPIVVAVKPVGGTVAKRTFDPLFANEINSSTPAQILSEPQGSLARVRHSADTWMAFDCCGPMAGIQGGGNNGYSSPLLTMTGIVFRHPNLSANFVYFDGHAENLKVGEIDGGRLYNDANALTVTATNFGTVGDARLLANH